MKPFTCDSLLRSGTIVDANPSSLTVEIAVQENCEQCAQGRGCGLGLFARRRSQRITVALPNDFPHDQQRYSIGSQVTISLPRDSVTLLAFYVYALPLIVALLLAGLSMTLSAALWFGPLVFFTALVGGVISVKYLLGGQSERFRPCLVS